MSTTPGSKLSPFNKGISKHLLTPCRRVGLSRKRKSPDSINKFLSKDSKSHYSSGKCPNLSSDTTPVNKRKSLVEFNSPLEKSDQLEVSEKLITAKKSLSQCFTSKKHELKSKISAVKNIQTSNVNVNDNKHSDTETEVERKKNIRNIENHKKTIGSSETRKAVLDVALIEKNVQLTTENLESKENFNEDNSNQVKKNDTPEEIVKKLEDTVIIETVAQIHSDSKNVSNNSLLDHDYSSNLRKCSKFLSFNKEKLVDENELLQCISDDNFSISSSNSSPIRIKSYKRRMLSDSDDDFHNSPPQNSKWKKTNSSITLLKKTNTCSDVANEMRDCKVSLAKISEDNFNKIPINEKDLSCKEDKILKKLETSDDSDGDNSDADDDDFCPSSRKIKKKKEKLKSKSLLKQKTNKALPTEHSSDSKKSSRKILKTYSSSKSLVLKLSSLDAVDEDEAFTSTPDREKNEKTELIYKIKELESKIKDKKQKIENLNRASLYKSKHNPDELRNLTEAWKQGCILALNDLLQKLQTHGPIDMPTLVKNLRIPENMVSRIFCNITN